MTTTPAVILARGRARPAWAGHPDVYDGAIDTVRGTPATGDEVDVLDHRDRYVGRGVWHASAPVRVRIYGARREPLDAAFVARRIRAAVGLRRDVLRLDERTDVYRVVHGAGDRLPGLAVDRYGPWAVVQVTARAMADRCDAVAGALREHLGVDGVWERASKQFSTTEDFPPGGGRMAGDVPPELVEVREDGVLWRVDLQGGAKTGHFADQRENRRAFAAICGGRRVLDAFSGTGGFGLAALVQGGAESVLALDAGRTALARAADNAAANGVSDRFDVREGDAFETLRALVAEGARFGAVSIDPPRFATSRRGVRGALRGYRDLNLQALALVEPGGLLATSSCTGALRESEFEEMLRDAAVAARRRLQVVHRGGQGADHPWLTAAPEGRYLKFVLARVL